MIDLRPYQHKDVANLRSAYKKGARRVIYATATGSGKSVAASYIIRSAVAAGRRVLVTVHRREIFDQTMRKLADFGVEAVAYDRKRDQSACKVVVATVQTLARASNPLPQADLVVVDEAHAHCEQQIRMQEALPKAWFLLLTASPCRTDGQPLPADVIVPGIPVTELQKQGFLVKTRVIAPDPPDFSRIEVRAGDFAPGPAESVVNKPKIVGSLVEHAKLLRGRRFMVFAAGKKHAKSVHEALLAAGWRSAVVVAETDEGYRERAWQRLRTFDLDCVVSVGVAIEGLDIPEVSGILWARPTCSLTVWMQGNGRGMRPAGSDDLLIVDCVGNVWRHGLPETEHEWSLREKRGGTRDVEAPAPLLHCRGCLAVWPAASGRVCPRCQTVLPAEVRAGPRAVPGTLREVSAAQLERQRRAHSASVGMRPAPKWAVDTRLWDRLERKRWECGYALGDGSPYSGWTAAMYRRIKSGQT